MIDFDKMIENHLWREQFPKKVGRYYPSEIGKCMRKLFYSYKYPQKVEPKLLKIFELGNILHGFIVDVLKSDKNPEVKLLETELPIKLQEKDFLISGRVDDLLLVNASGKKLLVEVKSCKDVSYIDKPQNHHAVQLQLYMHACSVHNGVILYIDKNTLETKTFFIEYDESWSRQLIERFRALHGFLTTNNLPKAEAKMLDDMEWMCRDCEYKGKCEKEEV